MANVEQETSGDNGGGSLIGRLLIVGFMGAVIGAECLFAYFWLPSADEVAAQVEQMAQKTKSSSEANEETTEGEESPAVEVELGNFTVTNHRLATETTFRLDFKLCGIVAEKDQKEFVKLFQRNEGRFRDLVIVEVRNCGISDLEDAGLGLIKRRFLEKSNALFGKPLLRSVIFAEYTFIEL